MKNEINVGPYRVSVDTTGNEDNMIEKNFREPLEPV